MANNAGLHVPGSMQLPSFKLKATHAKAREVLLLISGPGETYHVFIARISEGSATPKST